MSDAVGMDPQPVAFTAWPVNMDGEERNRLDQQFEADIAEPERLKIFQTAAKILGYCPSPKNLTGKRTGLALGKVQSGKTSSFIGLTALAYDNEYRIVIVLAGTKKNLVDQNTRRIKEQFAEGRADRKIAILSTTPSPEKGVRPQDVLGILKTGNNVLITLLKHPKHIAHLKSIFASSELNHYPTLIIDDEGDQASMNIKTRKRDESETFAQIVALRTVFKLHAYVAYTATPQAPLLVDTVKELSPQFCVRIEPGSGYTGGSTFHGANQALYTRAIPESEPMFEDTDGVPESFIRAISTFYVGAAIRTINGDKGYHSMLVHSSQRKDHHETVSRRVEALADSWREKLALPDGDPVRTYVLDTIKEAYDDLCKGPKTYPAWDKITNILRSPEANPRIWIVNSSDLGNIPTPENLFFKNNIFIGGNMLDRGVTLPGLAVTYITRWAKETQADTVEQRARWFGYKAKYLDLCRIFAPQAVLNGFADLLGHEDDLWASLQRWEHEGKDVTTWPRLFELGAKDSKMKPTRPGVAKTKTVKPGWATQSKPALDATTAAANVKAAQEFFSAHPDAQRESFDSVSHTVIRNCNPRVLAKGLLSRLVNSRNQWQADYLSELMARFVKPGSNSGLDVVWVTETPEGKKRVRTLNANNAIKNLMQGSNPPPNTYAGDRNIHNNRLQLQVHTITVKSENNPDLETVALALYLPSPSGAKRLVSNSD